MKVTKLTTKDGREKSKAKAKEEDPQLPPKQETLRKVEIKAGSKPPTTYMEEPKIPRPTQKHHQ